MEITKQKQKELNKLNIFSQIKVSLNVKNN